MKNKLYDKTYTNSDLKIPTGIWNDRTVMGVAKIILTLIKNFTKSGEKTCQALTLQMANIVHTHEKDIKYNLKKLHDMGHIKLFRDELSPTGWSIQYLYYDKPVIKEEPGGNELF